MCSALRLATTAQLPQFVGRLGLAPAQPPCHICTGTGPTPATSAPRLAPAQLHANCPAGHRRIDRHGGRTDRSRLPEQRTFRGSSCVGCHAGGKHVGSFGCAPRQLHWIGRTTATCRMHTLEQTAAANSVVTLSSGIVSRMALLIYNPTRRGIPYGMATGTAPAALRLCTLRGRRQRRAAVPFHSCRAPAAAAASAR